MAAALSTNACDGGAAVGCYNLGLWFEQVAYNAPRAARAYARGCELGEQNSCAKASR